MSRNESFEIGFRVRQIFGTGFSHHRNLVAVFPPKCDTIGMAIDVQDLEFHIVARAIESRKQYMSDLGCGFRLGEFGFSLLIPLSAAARSAFA